MKKVLVLSLVVLSFCFASGVQASDYPTLHQPIVSEKGRVMGTAYTKKQGEDIHIDFDFDAPYECKLTQLDYDIRNNEETFPRNENKQLKTQDFQYHKTFDKVRDAQVILDLPNRDSDEDVFISTRLEFDCGNKHNTIAWVEDGTAKNTNHYFKYVTGRLHEVNQGRGRWYKEGYYRDSDDDNPNTQWYPGYWEDRGADTGGRSSSWYPGYWEDQGARNCNGCSVSLGYRSNAQFSGPVNNPGRYIENYNWDGRQWVMQRVWFNR